MTRDLIAEKQANLERVRSERIALGATLAGLAEDVARAVDAARAAKLADVITPSPEAQRQAGVAGKALEAVVAKRDAAADRADLLDQAATALAAEIQDLDREVRKAGRAAAVVELTKRLDAGRTAAREWVVAAVAAEMIKGVIVTDLGLTAICALEPGRHISEVTTAISAAAAARREAVDRGEALP